MGGYAKFCLETLFGWLKSLAGQIWSALSGGQGTNMLAWVGEHWKGILLIICTAGILIDLAVYLFRWEPIKVWKSYFRRRKNRRRSGWEETGRVTNAAAEPADYAEAYPSDYPSDMPETVGEAPNFDTTEAETYPEENASFRPEIYRDPEDDYPNPEETYAEPEAAREELRNAGPLYAAPDKPIPAQYQEMYRRPVQQSGGRSSGNPDPGSVTRRNLEKVLGPRRRRSRVNELFRSSPDDGNIHYEAPQPVIDRTEAYQAPVYPRNWRENGDSPS